MNQLARTFEFDIEHFEVHDEVIMDSLSFNRIIHVTANT